jgi:lysophospholipase L1-like esterase
MQTLSVPSFTTTLSQKPQSLRIIALGDSLVYGYGDPVGGGWVERLRRQWMNPGVGDHVLYNLGIRGNGVIQVSERLEREWSNRGELRNRYPDLIILSVGVNDSARLGRLTGKLFIPFDQFQQQMARLLDQAQNLCPVLFVGMTPVDESKMPFLDCLYYNHIDQERYKEATRLACEQRGIPYLDIFEIWKQRGEEWLRNCLSLDGLHPNVQGYEALFRDVTNWQPIRQLSSI